MCKVNKKVLKLIPHCHAVYSFINDDTKSYDVGWLPINVSKPLSTTTLLPKSKPSKYKCQNSWCYQVIFSYYLQNSIFSN